MLHLCYDRFMDIVLRKTPVRRMETDISDKVVVMANDMIRGISKLSLMEAKFLRLLIMQNKPNDEDFGAFRISAADLAEVLQIPKVNIYREADKMTDHLMREVIKIGDGNAHHAWRKFQWLSYCEYESGVFTIQLHPELKPYLIGLRKWYTQYRIEEIIRFSSGYSIRIYELISMAMKGSKPYGDNVTEVYLDIETIRKATGTENKYTSANTFKNRIIDTAVKEINEKTSYHVDYKEYKLSRKIAGFTFRVQSQARYQYMERRSLEDAPPVKNDQIEGQMSLFDLPDAEEAD